MIRNDQVHKSGLRHVHRQRARDAPGLVGRIGLRHPAQGVVSKAVLPGAGEDP